MGCEVYANGDEIACKAGAGKVIAAFPDVCLTPPPPPAGPIPVPYADTSFSKDMQKGSKTVKIKGKEVMLKDKSFYKTAPLGDEAATRSQGANVITHVITGKTYFVSWSMDVRFEGQNVDRHEDLTTSNHASRPGGVPNPIWNLSVTSKKKNDFATKHIPECAPGGHKWDCAEYPCGRRKCPGCWVPPCVPNAKEVNDAYEAEQNQSKEELIKSQIAKREAEMRAQLAAAERHKEQIAVRQEWMRKGKANEAQLTALQNEIKERRGLVKTHEGAALGQQAEIDAIKKYADDITHAGFITHCTQCHREQEIDFITNDDVVEVKYEAKDHDYKQLTKVNSVRESCFKDRKNTVAMVPPHEADALKGKIETWKKDENQPGHSIAGKVTVKNY